MKKISAFLCNGDRLCILKKIKQNIGSHTQFLQQLFLKLKFTLISLMIPDVRVLSFVQYLKK